MIDPTAIKAMIFVLCALAAGYFVRPRAADETGLFRIAAYWFGGALVAFTFQVDAIRMFLLALLMLALFPPRPEQRAAFFILATIALPLNVTWVVPFPGINYLIIATHAVWTGLFIGIPMLIFVLQQKKRDDLPTTPFTDILAISTFLLVGLLNMRDTTITDGLRALTLMFVTLMVPYIVISRSLLHPGALRVLFNGVLMVSGFLVFAGLLTLLHNWHHYGLAGNNDGFVNTIRRGGNTRVIITLMHTLAGLCLSAAIFAFWYARKEGRFKILAYPLMFLAFVGLIGTQSRGAYLAFVISFGVLILLRIRSWTLRIGLATGGLVSMVVMYQAIKSSGFEAIDQYNTFSYRDQLLEAGLSYIPKHFLFGSTDYGSDPHFAHLVQGQGIIDFVNGYLQYALQWGVVGLGMWMTLWGWTILGAVKALDRFHAAGPEYRMHKAFGMGFVAFFVGLLFSFLTTSEESYYQFLLVGLVGVGSAYRRLSFAAVPAQPAEKTGRNKRRKPQAHSAPMPAATYSPEAKAPAGKSLPPEKKPFVIDTKPGAKGWPS